MLNLRDNVRIADITNMVPSALTKTAIVTSPNSTFQQIGQHRKCQDVVTNLTGIIFEDFLAWTAYWHNIEAWAYMGKALGSLKEGNFNSFIHLCYYSELRAALSFFTLNGIFICEDGLVYKKDDNLRYNPYRDSSRRYLRSVHLGTHKALWKCFSDFKNEIPFDYYLQKMTIFGTDAKSVLDHAMAGTGFHHNIILNELFNSASNDIFQRDRNTRNQVSYFPFHDVDNTFWCNADIDINLKSVGQIIKPTQAFKNIDLHIVKQFLKSQFASYAQTGESFLDFISRSFRDFFSTNEEYNTPIFNSLASDTEIDTFLSEYVKHNSNHIDYHKQLLSRTLIFLRLNMIHFKTNMTGLNFLDFENNHLNFFKNRKSSDSDIYSLKDEDDYLLERISISELIKIAHLVD